jgi:hypothetical protein
MLQCFDWSVEFSRRAAALHKVEEANNSAGMVVSDVAVLNEIV